MERGKMGKSLRSIFYRMIVFLIIIIYIWFTDYISYHLWIFPLFINLLVFSLFMILFVLRRKKQTEKKVRVINDILILLIVIFALLDTRLIKAKLNVYLFSKQMNEIVDKVQNDKSNYPYGKSVELPIHSYTSLNGKIYIYKNDDEQVFTFLISSMSTAGTSELVYSSGEEKLIRENIPGIEQLINLKKHWYYVRT